jgi:multidrug efflux pump
VIATGAGAEMRRSLGTAVFSGMLGVTLFGIFLTPVFFYVIQGLGETQLFAPGGVARRIGSPLAGGLTGFAVGFLLARLIELGTVWEVAIGATAAILGALLVLALERMASRRTPRRCGVVSRPRHNGFSPPPSGGGHP